MICCLGQRQSPPFAKSDSTKSSTKLGGGFCPGTGYLPFTRQPRLTREAKTQDGSSSTTTYTYDKNGNQLTKTSSAVTVTNTYNAFDQLSKSVVGDTTTTYTYAPSGLRFTKQTTYPGITYLYDGDILVAELRGSGVIYKYTYGVDLVSYGVYKYPDTTDYYYLRNGHGDVTYLTDEDGAITKTYEYDAFGNEEAPDSADTNPFRYAGEYYDTETGTYYLRARYYDPVIGRFTQEDPARHSTNWYLYCYCNPVRYIDPSGKIPVETFADAASAWFSFKELINNPSWGNVGFFAWDLAALFTPYVTGSYAA